MAKTNLHDELKNIFLTGYYKLLGRNYIWSAKDNRALGQLIAKMRLHHNDKLTTDEMKQAIRDFFYIPFKIKNDWYSKNFSMPIINSKFNELMNEQTELNRQLNVARTPKHIEFNNGRRVNRESMKTLGEVIRDFADN